MQVLVPRMELLHAIRHRRVLVNPQKTLKNFAALHKIPRKPSKTPRKRLETVLYKTGSLESSSGSKVPPPPQAPGLAKSPKPLPPELKPISVHFRSASEAKH